MKQVCEILQSALRIVVQSFWDTDYGLVRFVHFRVKAGADIFCHHCRDQHTRTVSVWPAAVCGHHLLQWEKCIESQTCDSTVLDVTANKRNK